MQTSKRACRIAPVAATWLIAMVVHLTGCSGASGQSWHAAWLTATGNAGWDIVNGMAADSAGNVYITGCTTDTVLYPANQAVSTNTRRFVFLAKFDTSGVEMWRRNLFGTEEGNGSFLSVAGDGSLILAGCAYRWLTDARADAGYKEMFAASLDGDGHLIWKQTFAAGKTDRMTTLAVNPLTGMIQITGTFTDTIAFSGKIVTPQGKSDAFILELNPGGTFRHLSALGGKGNERIEASVFDSAGNNYLAGTFQKKIKSGDLRLDRNPGARGDGIFLIKRDPSGKCILAREAGSGKKVGVRKLVQQAGRLFLGASFSDDVTVEGQVFTSAGSDDCFLMCLDGSLKKQWIRQLGGIRKDRIKDMAMDNDRIVLTGSFEDGLKMGCSEIVPDEPEASVFILSLGAGGEMKWNRTLGSDPGAYPQNLIITRHGHLLLAGSFRTRMALQGKEVNAKGEEDIFITRLENCRNMEPSFRTPEILCAGHPVKLDAGGGFVSYLWAGGPCHDRYYEVTDQGNYAIELVSKEGCRIFDTVAVMNDPGPVVNIGNDTTISTAMQVTLHAGKGFTSYQWNNGGKDSVTVIKGAEYGPGKHYVSVMVAGTNGCTAGDEIVVEITRTDEELAIAELSSAVSLFPNPATDQVCLVISRPIATLDILVTDLAGHVLDERKISGYTAGQIVEFQMGNLPAGLYAFEISDKTSSVVKKIVLQ